MFIDLFGTKRGNMFKIITLNIQINLYFCPEKRFHNRLNPKPYKYFIHQLVCNCILGADMVEDKTYLDQVLSE